MNAKLDHFSELSKFLDDKSSVCSDFLSLLDKFELGRLIHQLKMDKAKGASSQELLEYLLIFRLFGQNIHQSLNRQFGEFVDGGKNQFYRFLTRPSMDWRRLLLRTAKSFFRIAKEHSEESGEEREMYFILDDTMLEKFGRCMEGIGKVFDHVAQRYALGYKLLLLTITDATSTLPLDFSLHSEPGKNKNFGLTKKQLKDRFTKKRSKDDCMKRRTDELLMDKPSVALQMIKRAVKNGFTVKYLLMDKWFFGKEFIQEVRKIKQGAIHVITLLRNKGTYFYIDGKKMSTKALIQKREREGFKQCRKYKCLYASVKADYHGTPVRLFIIRYGRSSKYEVMVTTDLNLKFIDAFERYQIRWNIEVLFYECKQYLELGKCQSTDLNAQIADCTLAFIGYSVISLRKRFSDYESLGELFRNIQDGLLELTFIERLLPMIAKLLERIARLFDSTLDDLMERAMADEEARQDLEFILRDYQYVKERA